MTRAGAWKRSQVVAGLLLAALGMAGCSQTATDTRAADEAAIREADAAWNKAAAAKDLEGYLSFFTDDAVFLGPDVPMSSGKAAIRAGMQNLFGSPGFALQFQPEKVEAARSGDLGYVRGTSTLVLNDPAGRPLEVRGKYVEIWKKQADGKWKCILGIPNADAPPSPAK